MAKNNQKCKANASVTQHEEAFIALVFPTPVLAPLQDYFRNNFP